MSRDSHVSLSMTASAKPNIIGLSEVGSSKRRHGSRLSTIAESGAGGSGSSSEVGSKLKSMSSVGKALAKRASEAAKDGADASRAAMWQEVLQAATPPQSTTGKRLEGGGDAAGAGDGTGAGPGGATKASAQAALNSAKAVCNKVAQSRILVSLLVFLTTVILLLVINPPMAQEPASPGESPKRSWKKISVWSTIAMLLALILPYTTKSACLGSGGG